MDTPDIPAKNNKHRHTAQKPYSSAFIMEFFFFELENKRLLLNCSTEFITFSEPIIHSAFCFTSSLCACVRPCVIANGEKKIWFHLLATGWFIPNRNLLPIVSFAEKVIILTTQTFFLSIKRSAVVNARLIFMLHREQMILFNVLSEFH